MPIRVRIPLPGPFVYISGGRHRAHRKGGRKTPADPAAIVLSVMLFVIMVIVFILSGVH